MKLLKSFYYLTLGLALGINSLRLEAQSSLFITRESYEQKIPFLSINSNNQREELTYLHLKWEPFSETDFKNGLQFQFDGSMPPETTQTLQLQLWPAALAGSLVWQKTWPHAYFTLSELTGKIGSEACASLAVALLATASGTSYPENTLLLASLLPDHSLGPIENIESRLEAVAKTNIKRVILSKNQRLDYSNANKLLDTSAKAKALRLEISFANTLAEAAEQMLKHSLPIPPTSTSFPSYSNGFFSYLAQRCQSQLGELTRTKNLWPTQEQLQRMNPWEKAIWQRVFFCFDQGNRAYQAGQVYAAYRLLSEASSQLAATQAFKNDLSSFDLKSFAARVTTLIDTLTQQSEDKSWDQGTLASALLIAERNDWLCQLKAKLEGPLAITRQAWHSQSDATAEQKRLAATLLICGFQEVTYQLQQPDIFKALRRDLKKSDLTPSQEQSSQLLSQLTPALLAQAESFVEKLKRYGNQWQNLLIWDTRLAAQTAFLNRTKSIWEKNLETHIQQTIAPRAILANPGFTPGPAYRSSKASISAFTPSSLSETAQSLLWANGFSENALLQQKYFQLNANLNLDAMQWQLDNRIALEKMLQNAENAAREGIAVAQKLNFDTSSFALIYEYATILKISFDDNDRLEALRHFWRCYWLGSLSAKLGTIIPQVDSSPAKVESEETESSNESDDFFKTNEIREAIPVEQEVNP